RFAQEWSGGFAALDQPHAMIRPQAIERLRPMVVPELTRKQLQFPICRTEQTVIVEPALESLPQLKRRTIQRQFPDKTFRSKTRIDVHGRSICRKTQMSGEPFRSATAGEFVGETIYKNCAVAGMRPT